MGANEAPPAIISMFIGTELEAVLDAVLAGETREGAKKIEMEIGVDVLPAISKDTTDRNRTSPFAFTGNKFEFRSLGSSLNIAGPNIVLNTIVAETLSQFADRLEKAADFEKELNNIVKETYRDHKRVIFNGNNYSDEWLNEATRRGLPNLVSAVDALPAFVEQKSIDVFTKHGVFSETEIHSRYEILLENYSKVLNIEALTMIDMASKQILPSVIEYNTMLCDAVASKKNVGVEAAVEEKLAKKVSALVGQLASSLETLEQDVITAKGYSDALESAEYYHATIFTDMQTLRTSADELETIVGEDYWPLPTYADLLF